ncbi:UDP-N-acetylmuramate--L-alanine ligase [Ornithinimicrobium cavernae]|uniref:UDP-N-acetylmuramate--L-alanine ligase n=1 Tax=Ornithinimicrobium cavernae TaxID=2666047 RepID=UPI000D69B92B|nr:UDP-N-acetylmuramate--L-alanine ligase [Ornithinimicrobium cavernae]
MTAGVNDRFDFTAPVPPVADLGPVHFIAIGGSGMSGVARMFLAAGVPVSGSDARDSATLRALEAEGARVFVGQDAANVGPEVETVVISSAIRESNPELAAARERGLRVLHRAQGIAALLPGRSAVAVAGANGKTTTSGMLTVALQHSGADPSYVLGSPLTTPDGHGTNAAPGTGPFVIEADESDGSFLTYHPDVAVVTNIKPDHLDFYGDLATIEATFTRFAATIAEGGLLVAAADDRGAATLAAAHHEAGGAVATFGTDESADVWLTELRPDAMTATAHLTWQRDLAEIPAGTTRTLSVPLPGAHNLANAAAALVAATAGLGQDLDAVLAGLAAYPGTHRRFERVGEAAGVLVVDDYAHNPDKVAAVVRAGRGLVDSDGGRLVVVFQPHLYSRTRDFASDFAAGLSAADVVVLLDVYAAREDPLEGVSGATIADLVNGPQVHYVSDRDAVVPTVADLVEQGDLVLTVGAGDVTELGGPLLEQLAERERA